MSSDNGSGRQGGDRGGSTGYNLLMYLGFGAIIATLVALYVLQMFQTSLDYTDLERLVAASQYEKDESKLTAGSPGYIDVKVEARNTLRRMRVSNLRKVELGPTAVRGQIDLVELKPVGTSGDRWEPDSKTLRQNVEFRTNLSDKGSNRDDIETAIRNSNIPFRHADPPGPWEQHSQLIIGMLLAAMLIYIVVRRLSAAGSPMSFGRSRGKLYAQEELGITFNDVAGIDEAVEEVREVVDFLRSPEKYQKLGGRIPKGVLLVGPPGTGKTLLAKAIAGEAGVPFFSLSGSDFVEMFVGVGAARVRDMFQQAEAKAPCIIFIDELDALGKSRGAGIMGGHDEREQTLNALLVEMDGFGSNSGVIVMAATNRPETLDPALLRPGRFDRHVLVDRPDIKGREDILKVHVKNVKLDPTVDLHKVAAITPGFVGADLANLVNEAALLAARAEKTAVGMNEFNEGVERVTAGLEKKQRVMNEDEKLRVAYHESGHALVAYSLPNTDPVHKVSIIPRGLAALGYTMQRPEGDRFLMTQSELESRIQVLLAGTIAEEIIFTDISTGAQNDLERATDIARRMCMEFGMSRLGRVNYRESNRSAFLASGGSGEERVRSVSEQTLREIDQEVRRIIDESIEKVRHILDVRRGALVSLTNRLMEVESVDSDELKRIIDETSPGPLVVPGTLPANTMRSTTEPVITAPATERSG
ncbi:ATP-dependent metalloprotease FtsH [Pirellula staleyi DSM 6068]|uniref:ATP-dependent zinc metalloprotease FtsH n=1 Tax=Pirellula staleyi (strain ATCC 27377 / DSM 6068 / ICPB 4128) TaxID=530564 RepID=FTSH_PIRSD|nr:ATP-dependent zinc metalloprotease FtsH [Pirellula staleyi]D2QZ34.1 RecName: Full=ATP-dependent zinc metalloprotease FtsH [Pirellula staleyi DSM 6068]ADB18226.1 ATP-dependent metalloprotease FtsH [Pirellula staleyi DSM 6068]